MARSKGSYQDKQSKSSSSRNGRRNNRSGNNPKPENKSSNGNGNPTISRTSGNTAVQNIIANSANIATRNIAGYPIKLGNTSGDSIHNITTGNLGYIVPGAFGVAYLPLFGSPTGLQTDPVNLAARNIWMNLRSLYSNKIPYTAGAIMKYVLAMDSIMMVFQVIKRMYGIVFAYDAKNSYVPDALILAQGVSPSSIRSNLPDIKVTMNDVAARLSAFGVPTQFDFIYDHVDAAGHIFMDGVSNTAQFIIPFPAFAWKMDWANDKLYAIDWRDDSATTIGEAEGSSWNHSSAVEWSYIKSTLYGMVEALVNNEDCYQIGCDMQRMYGNLAGVAPLDDTYAIGPEYSSFYADMLHNASWMDVRGMDLDQFQLTELNTVQDVGAIKASYTTPGLNIGTTHHKFNGLLTGVVDKIFDFNREDFSMEDVINASNWKFVVTPKNKVSNALVYSISSCGTLAMAYTTLVSRLFDPSQANPVGNLAAVALTLGTVQQTGLTTHLMASTTFAGIDNWEDVFDLWHLHPLVDRITVSESGTSPVRTLDVTKLRQPSGDMEYYFTVSNAELANIHKGIALARFDGSGDSTIHLSK